MQNFFVKDKVACGEIKLKYKPTEDMWVNVNTKPKKGWAYQIDCGHIMNCVIDIPDETIPLSNLVKQQLCSVFISPQECGGRQSKESPRGKKSVTWGKYVKTILKK